MTTATLTEADVRVRDAVMRQLDWDPEVDASAIEEEVCSRAAWLESFYPRQRSDVKTRAAAT